MGFPGRSINKESAHNAGDQSLIPGLGRSPGEGIPTPVFLPGEFHGQRSLAGYSPWDHRESDTTEQLNNNSTDGSAREGFSEQVRLQEQPDWLLRVVHSQQSSKKSAE